MAEEYYNSDFEGAEIDTILDNAVRGDVSQLNDKDANWRDTARRNIEAQKELFLPLPISKGGTASESGQQGINNLIDLTRIVASGQAVSDDTVFISRLTNSNSDVCRRQVSDIWLYIMSKISSVLGLTASQYHGNADTATTADTATSVPTQAIPSGADLNDYQTPGEYYIATATVARQITNIPIQYSMGITVRRIGSAGYWQQAFTYYGTVYERYKSNNTGNEWSEWTLVR